MTTRHTTLLAGAAAAALISASGASAAQDLSAEPDTGGTSYSGGELPAPRRAFELTLGAGYMQGFGRLQEGTPVGDTAAAGMSFELGVAYRVSPRWAIGLTGGYQTFETGDELDDDAGPDGATARVDATYHFQPYSRLDPWLKLGTGYRHLCECGQSGDVSRLNGLELANLSAGLDLRVSQALGLAPVIGAGLDMFLWDGTETIDDPRLSTFVFAGLQVRFDIGGQYDRGTPVALASH